VCELVVRFSIINLCWLTIAVAIVAALARFLGIHYLGLILIVGGFVFAPLLLALVSSFFQNVPARTRKRIAYVVLAILGWPPILIATLLHPAAGLVVGVLVLGSWVTQIDIFNDLHEQPEDRN
jgi:hypothetical protein